MPGSIANRNTRYTQSLILTTAMSVPMYRGSFLITGASCASYLYVTRPSRFQSSPASLSSSSSGVACCPPDGGSQVSIECGVTSNGVLLRPSFETQFHTSSPLPLPGENEDASWESYQPCLNLSRKVRWWRSSNHFLSKWHTYPATVTGPSHSLKIALVNPPTYS